MKKFNAIEWLKKSIGIGLAVAIAQTVIKWILGDRLNLLLGLVASSNPVSLGTFLLMFTYGFVGGTIIYLFWWILGKEGGKEAGNGRRN